MDTNEPLPPASPSTDPFWTPRLNQALALAQAEMGPAIKGKVNPHFKSSYADLASVIMACSPLGQHGIAFTQPLHCEGRTVTVHTILRHASGETLDCGSMTATAKDDGPQAIGSVVTYLRRYTLMAAVGIAADDDDGNAGQGGRRDDGWRDERPEPRTERQTAPAKPGHHASWDRNRAPFCSAIQKLGREYEDIAKWLVANGKPRPSAMTIAQRQELYAYLENLGTKDLPDTVSRTEAK